MACNVTMTLSADYEDKVEGTASLRVDYSVPENGENYYAFLQWKPSGLGLVERRV